MSKVTDEAKKAEQRRVREERLRASTAMVAGMDRKRPTRAESDGTHAAGAVRAVQEWSKGIEDSQRPRGRVKLPAHGIVVHVVEDGNLVHLRCTRGIEVNSQTLDLKDKEPEEAGGFVVDHVKAAIRDLLGRSPKPLSEVLG